MLVQMLSGHIVDVFPDVADAIVRRGEGTKLADGGFVKCDGKTVGEIMFGNAENHGGVCATTGIEMAMLEPKTEQARIKYERTPKSRSDEVQTWLGSLFKRNQASNQ